MKRVILGVVAVIALMFVMIGCKGDPIKDDLISYSKSAIPLVNKYGVDLPKKVEEANKDSKQYLAVMSKEVVPMMKEYREKMAAIKPATKELQDIHGTFVKNLTDMEEVFKMLVKAVETKDAKLLQTANEKIAAVAPGEDKFKKDIEELAKKHDVKFQ